MSNQYHADAEALYFEGNGFMQAGDISGAERCFRKAIQISPDFSEAYANLGMLLDGQGNAAAAEACYQQSIALNPEVSRPHLNLGALLAEQKRFDEAEAAYMQAIALNPDAAAGWSNLGVLYACMKREAEAEQCYRTAIHLDASYTKARFNLSYLLLRQARFEEGWSCLEARNWNTVLASSLTFPRWQGESLAGKSIMISYEAGHGDMIQFCRYAALLKAQGAVSIAMVCHPALATLFTCLQSVDTIIPLDRGIPGSGWDVWTPLMSIPYHCKTRLENIPASIPYLRATSEHIAKWAALTFKKEPRVPRSGLRVGLVWKGNPKFENDADRSLPSLQVLAPLWTVPGVCFVSLQKGAGEDEVGRFADTLPLIDVGSQFEDFADTAAVVASLDLVICVDTAIAHLSGALGKACWVMLPAYKADWRWLADRTDTPWYPEHMRLFRQSRMGDWSDVVNDIVRGLGQLVTDAH